MKHKNKVTNGTNDASIVDASNENVEETKVEETKQVEQPATESNTQVVEQPTKKEDKKSKVSKKDKADDKKNKKPKVKKQSKFGKRVKETTSELKKVTWPTFGSVLKKTGIVLAVVLIFAVVLFGIDRLLSWLFDLLTTAMK